MAATDTTQALPRVEPGPGAGRFPRARIALRRSERRAGATTRRATARILAPFAALTLVLLIAPWLVPYSSTDIAPAGPLQGMSPTHPLGTDELGRDVLSRVVIGARTSWLAALGVIGLGAVVGGVVGAVAGAAGGKVDMALMRLTDLFLSLPAIVLAIAIVAALGPSLLNTLIALSVVWWPWYARIVRGEVRALASRPHAEAARLAGASRTRLVTRHLLPGAIAPVVVTMSLDVGNLILALAGLSFIGLGAPPPAPELGGMSARGLQYLFGHPWVSIAPAAGVALLAFAANLLGDRVNRQLDQRTNA